MPNSKMNQILILPAVPIYYGPTSVFLAHCGMHSENTILRATAAETQSAWQASDASNSLTLPPYIISRKVGKNRVDNAGDLMEK